MTALGVAGWQLPKGPQRRANCRELITVLAAARVFPFQVFYFHALPADHTTKESPASECGEATPWMSHGPLGIKVLSAPFSTMPQRKAKDKKCHKNGASRLLQRDTFPFRCRSQGPRHPSCYLIHSEHRRAFAP